MRVMCKVDQKEMSPALSARGGEWDRMEMDTYRWCEGKGWPWLPWPDSATLPQFTYYRDKLMESREGDLVTVATLRRGANKEEVK